MADVTPAQKSRLAKICLALLALLAGAGGADAAGYTPDLESVKQLGLGGSIALIVYLELRVMPLFMRIAARDQREAAVEQTAAQPAAEHEPELALAPVPALVRPARLTPLRVAVIPRAQTADDT